MPPYRRLVWPMSIWAVAMTVFVVAAHAYRRSIESSHFSMYGRSVQQPGSEHWRRVVRSGFGWTRVIAVCERTSPNQNSLPLSLSLFHAFGSALDPICWSVSTVPPVAGQGLQRGSHLHEWMYGWPFRMVGTRAISPAPPQGTLGFLDMMRMPTTNPQIVIWWPGLILNAVIGLAANLSWLAANAMFFQTREHRRIRRGLCRHCGHPRLGLRSAATPCTECGQNQV